MFNEQLSKRTSSKWFSTNLKYFDRHAIQFPPKILHNYTQTNCTYMLFHLYENK